MDRSEDATVHVDPVILLPTDELFFGQQALTRSQKHHRTQTPQHTRIHNTETKPTTAISIKKQPEDDERIIERMTLKGIQRQ